MELAMAGISGSTPYVAISTSAVQWRLCTSSNHHHMATTSSALVVSGTVSGSNGPSAVRPSPSAYESLLVHHTAALPYIDREIDDPKWRARVDAEVAAEARAGISARARIDERIEQVLGPAYDWHRPTTSVGLLTPSCFQWFVDADDSVSYTADPRDAR